MFPALGTILEAKDTGEIMRGAKGRSLKGQEVHLHGEGRC